MSKKFKRMVRRLWWRTLPRRVWCALHLRHRWEAPDAVIIDGPIDLPPREREWAVLAFHKQCVRCYLVKSVTYTFTDAVNAVRASIEEDENDD